MINTDFWNVVKVKWIRDKDPNEDAIGGIIVEEEKTPDQTQYINDLLNGNLFDSGKVDSLDSLNSMLEGLNDLGVDSIPF